MKLWIDKRQTKAHVGVVFGNRCPDKKKVIACFVSKKKRKNGYFGTVYLRKKSPLTVVVHELVHVAMHYIEHFTDRDGYNSMDDVAQYDYFSEASAYAVENLFKQYIKETTK